MREIQWNNRTRKQIKKIPKNYQEAVLQNVDELAGFPNCTGIDIKALKKHKYDYRLRVGRYRVLFDDEERLRIIAIQEVKKRDNSTY